MLSMRAPDCLVALVEQGSLTGAPAVPHLSQPGASCRGRGHGALVAADRAVTAGRSAAAGGADGRTRIACAESMTTWVPAPVLRRAWVDHLAA
jgi:DNA-binding transcriptional LysR family regulator